jgi:hypothetical protein
VTFEAKAAFFDCMGDVACAFVTCLISSPQ